MTDDETHMRREIDEIPEAAARLLDAVRRGARRGRRRSCAARDPRFVTTVARGSSDHAAAFLKYAIELTAGIPVASLGPSIASIYGAKLKLAQSACLAISQSGKSPDIVAMAEDGARRRRADDRHHQHRRLAARRRLATMRSTSRPGAEKSVAATKTFVNSARRRAGAARRTGPATRRCLRRWRPLAGAFREGDRLRLDGHRRRACRRHNSLFILGRGPSAAIANEAALKFKETCGMHAEAYSAAEVMHGPLALVKQGFPVLALAARDALRAVDGRDGRRACRQGRGGVRHLRRCAQAAARLPFAATGHPLTDPLALIVSFYAFVEAFARHRGLDPDEPRNLRKVTETL